MRGDGRGQRPVVHAQPAQGQVLDHRHARPGRHPGDQPAATLREHRSGGVLVGGDQVDEARPHPLQQVLERLGHDPAPVQRDADRAHPRAAHDVEHTRVGDLLRQHRRARLAQQRGHQADRLLRARGDQDLLAARGHPLGGHQRGDLPAQLGHAGGVVPGPVHLLRQGVTGHLAQHPAHHGGRRRARRGELDHVLVLVQQAAVELGREGPLAGRGRVGRTDPRAAALAAVEPARLLQLPVGPHDRRPAQLQPPRQVALGREHVAHAQLAPVDGRRQGAREPVVEGARPHGPRPQEHAQPVGSDLHRANDPSKAIEWQVTRRETQSIVPLKGSLGPIRLIGLTEGRRGT